MTEITDFDLEPYICMIYDIVSSSDEEVEAHKAILETVQSLVSRVCRRITKAELARRIGVDPSFISKLANGKRVCAPSRYYDIYDVYVKAMRHRTTPRYKQVEQDDFVEAFEAVRRFLFKRSKLKKEIKEVTPELVARAIEILTLPGLARQLPKKWTQERVERASRGLEELSPDDFIDIVAALIKHRSLESTSDTIEHRSAGNEGSSTPAERAD